MSPTRWTCVGALLCAVVTASSIAALTPGQATGPKLLVLLVVDQMRADYVDLYGHQWTAGLRTLIDEGAYFSDAAYPYRATMTCSGHATISTGNFPDTHGMVQNDWWNRPTARRITCTTDDDEQPVAYTGHPKERHSPRRLLTSTLADVLREQSPTGSRIISMSLKPRSAVTLAGQQADSVVWFDQSNNWATSTFFSDHPVPEVAQYISQHPVESDLGRIWSRLLPAARYRHDDDGLGESPPRVWTSVFPHSMNDGSGRATDTFYTLWRTSPFADEYLIDMAISMVEAFELGTRESTDYLAVGLSALDIVGHSFGPDSHEVQDVLARLDAQIGRLLGTLDTHLGRQNYSLALSSDHSIPPIPETANLQGLSAGRIDSRPLVRSLESVLQEHLGQGDARYVSALLNGDLYFEPEVYQLLGERPEVLDLVVDVIRDTRGVARVFRSEKLRRAIDNPGIDADDTHARAARLSHVEARSGDLILVHEPYWLASTAPTTYGSLYSYDTAVPVILYGAGIAAGHHTTSITPADIAPTLAFLAGVEMADTEGRVLTEALVP